jgi:hypothetical protein
MYRKQIFHQQSSVQTAKRTVVNPNKPIASQKPNGNTVLALCIE